jgi:hypothetical protein
MAYYRDILDSIDEVWLQMYEHGVRHHEFGCIDHTYATTKDTNKYAQVRYKGKKYYCHVVAAIRHLRRAPENDDEASHLCGRPWCIEWTHLTFESGLVNKSRLCCQLYLGVTPGYICPHYPGCLVFR